MDVRSQYEHRSAPHTDARQQAHVFGSPLTEADFQQLERCGIPRALAEQAGLRRVDSLTGAEMMGRAGRSGDYAGVIFTYTAPWHAGIREYRLWRDHPDLEMSGGQLKEKAKYVAPPGRGNLLYFAPNVSQEWLEDVSLPVVIVEGEKKCLAVSQLAWYESTDTAEKPSWLAIGLSGV
jgi:hypothetical protein